ncbi:MAG TPA: phosphotransferase family protein [Acidimicrobiales bacterium]|nr:phosphotransferase family protein [Acidimicrobiales bacterium]
MNAVAGIELERVEAWIAAHVEAVRPPLAWTRLAGGHSNLTYMVEDGRGARAVVRRPPLGELQPKAHDMQREFRIISALWPTPVPVARPHGYCGDAGVTGAPFYVMAHVDGRACASGEELTAWLPERDRQGRAAESYIDAMAELHVLDPDDIGLGDLARREDFVGRQLASWYRSWTSSAPDSGDDPRVHELHDLLASTKPAPGPLRVVHGDLGLHNCLVARDGAVAAVLDWEVCTLGDARFDLAYLLNRWSIAGAVLPGREAITMPATFPTAEEAVARYAARTGADLSGLDYFLTLNHWRSACIAQGVYARYVRGQKPADGVDVEGFRRAVAARLEAAEAAAAPLRRDGTLDARSREAR